jgi:RNA polymerase primary sigma factor
MDKSGKPSRDESRYSKKKQNRYSVAAVIISEEKEDIYPDFLKEIYSLLEKEKGMAQIAKKGLEGERIEEGERRTLIEFLEENGIKSLDKRPKSKKYTAGNYQENAEMAFMRDSSSIPLLTRREEIYLALRVLEEDEDAKKKLIESNFRLVTKIALQWKQPRFNLGELISEGSIGLINAAKKYDPRKGAKFSTTASWWINQAIRRYVTERKENIRLPSATRTKIRRKQETQRRLRKKLRREPTEKEIRDSMGIKKSTLKALLLAEKIKETSLQGKIIRGEEGGIEKFVEDPNSRNPYEEMREKETPEIIKRGMEILDDREKEIIRSRYGFEGRKKTLEELSVDLELTRERVRQIQKRALEKMRRALEREENCFPKDPCEEKRNKSSIKKYSFS